MKIKFPLVLLTLLVLFATIAFAHEGATAPKHELAPRHEMEIVFHPPLVHFPIAFYFLELVLLLFWAARKDPAFLRFARFSFNLGFLFMLAAIVAGLVDAGGLQGIKGKVRPHFYGAVTVFGIYTTRLFIWRSAEKTSSIHLAGAVLGTLVVMLTAFLGSEIVY